VLIDCDSCAMQHTTACDDCIVTALLDGASDTPTAGPFDLDPVESHALENLADAGLVAPLRLVPRHADTDAATG